ncbi:MAG: ATP-binding cassette domain-containing protein [Lachnospiraceae bacterium]|jgi:D-xylose transport system ATP-binding protein|nr:ATP-binding cassette domain-containing protein [Lachnospiraceae bacterium]
MKSDNVLELWNIRKEFSGVEVLHGIDLCVRRGCVHSLVGENGAGKSTLMKILSGFYPYGEYSGELVIDGQAVRFSDIRMAEEAGIEIISQELELVGQLTVFENIFLGKELVKNGILDSNQMICRSREIFERFGLDINPAMPVESLGIGQQQMVAIAKALLGESKVLIFDEPTAALTEAEADKLFDIIAGLRAKGITCIYISHRLGEVLRLSDDITVIRDGNTIVTDTKDNFTEDRLISCMVGRTMENRFPKSECVCGEVMLRVRDMTAYNVRGKCVVDHVSFEAHAGEVVGIAGLMGSGRTELVSCIFGAFEGTVKGSIELAGEPVSIRTPADAIRRGLGMVVEDRKSEGLALCLDLIHNISMASLDKLTSFGVVNAQKEVGQVQEMIRKLSVRASRLTLPVERLSGGNQQKVSVARMLATGPKVLILDEPTRGVDVGAKYELYVAIKELAKAGVTIVMVSSELPEILGMADRILVMKGGRMTGELSREEATQEKIMYYATLEEERQ